MNSNQPTIETKNYRKPKMPKKKKILIAAVSSFSALCIAAAGFWFLHPHKFSEWQVISPATCIKNGEERRECFCGETEIREISALGHKEKILAGVPATCTQTGLTDGKFCETCETLLLAQSEIPMSEHKIEIIAAIAPTCTEAGITEGQKCSDCGAVLIEQTEVEALGHKPETLASKEPTCTSDGFTNGTYCTVCEEVLSAQEIIPASHTPVADKGYAPTKTEDGLSDGSHCSVCGEVLEAQKVLHATGSLGLEFYELTDMNDKLTEYGVGGIGTCTDTEVIIPEYYNGYKVKRISSTAFWDCANITSVAIPNSVEFIGDRAFYDCANITSVAIPNSVESIGKSAFYGCTSLKSVIVPDSVTEIGESAFRGCTSLESLTLPFVGGDQKWEDNQYFGFIFGSVRYGEVGYDGTENYIPESLKTVVITGGKDIKKNAFFECEFIESIILPTTIKSIGGSAFSSCYALKGIVIPEGVTSIGSGAFDYCISLESLTLPESLTSMGEWVFRNCKKLTSVTIPKNMESIGEATFADTLALESIEVASGNTAYYSEGNCLVDAVAKKVIAGCKNSVIPEGVTCIGSNAFYGCKGLTGVTLPASVTSIEYLAFSESGIESVSFGGTLSDWEVMTKGSNWNSGTAAYTVYCADGEVTKTGVITHYARVTDPYVAPTCTETGLTEGAHCSVCGKIWVEQEVIPATGHTEVIKHGYAATRTEDGLSDCVYCSVCGEILVPEEVIYAYGSLGLAYSVTSETECKITGMGTCEDTELIIPRFIDGYEVTNINYGAFAGNTDIKSVRFSESLKYFNSGVFAGCTSLEKIEVASGNTTFHSEGNCLILTADNYLVMGCKTSVIPNGVTAIGSYAFENCTTLESITIPGSVTHIYSNAFAGCTGLKSIELPSGLVRIADGAFSGCTGFTEATVPSTVTYIGKSAFGDCTSLESITLPFVGQDKKWPEYQYFGYIFGSSSYTENAEKIPESLKNVVITGSTDIAENAFYGCAGLESVSLKGAVKAIGNNAFAGCTGLKRVTLSEGLTTLGTAAFLGCTGLESIALPSTLKTIGEWVFMDCTGLTEVMVPQGVTIINNLAFSGCTGLESITLPTSVTTMGYRVFENCTSLTSIEIPYQVTSIGNMTFNGCTSLTSVTIARGTTKIGNEAFKNCALLERITYKGTLEEWQAVSTGMDWNSGTGDYTVYCDDGEITKDGEVTHYNSEVIDEAVDPTCTETGLTQGSHCGICGKVFVAQEVIPATGHTEVVDVGYPATKTENGLTDGKHCDICGEVLVEQEIIYAYGSQGLAYNVTSETTCEITGMGDCEDTELVIPKYIDGYEVASIGDDAFWNCESLTSITIPESVTSIGNNAFWNCSGLTSITYNSTIAEWQALPKGTDWDTSTPDYTIYCTDGTIAKDGTVTYY